MAERFTDLNTVQDGKLCASYDAVDSTTGDTVRLHRFHASGDEREGLKQLFRALQKLDHRGLEKVIAVVDEASQELEIALEPERGTPLDQVLEEGPLTVDEFEQVATGLLNAVAAVHDLGLVHGAIRPGLVWVDREDPKKWLVRLHGFGLGFGDAAGEGREVIEAYQCAAPEQWEGAGARRCSDVWSMGCVLYQALCNRPAFEAKGLKELRTKHLKHDLLDLAKLAPQVPKWVSSCVMRLMALEADDRPRKAGVALEIFQKGEEEEVNPTENAPPPRPAATGMAPVAGGTSGVVPVPPAAQVMPQWTGAVKPGAPTPGQAKKPVSATKLVERRAPSSSTAAVAARRTVSSAAQRPEKKPVGAILGAVAGVLVVAGIWGMTRDGDPGATLPESGEVAGPGKPAPPKPVPPNPVAGAPGGEDPLRVDPLNAEHVLLPLVPFPGNPDLERVEVGRPVSASIPPLPDRDLPPMSGELLMHLRADHLVFGYGEGPGVVSRLKGEGPVADWLDVSPLGGSLPVTTFPWQLTQRSIERQQRRPTDSFPLRDPRDFVCFHPDEPPVVLSISRRAKREEMPFGQGKRDALTLALVFFAENKGGLHPLMMMGGQNGMSRLSVRMNASGPDSLMVEVGDTRAKKPKGRTLKKLETGKLDLSIPTLLVWRWHRGGGLSQLTLRNAAGARVQTRAVETTGPSGSLQEVALGGRTVFSWKSGGDPQATFRGGIAEMLLYREALNDEQVQMLEEQLAAYYFPADE